MKNKTKVISVFTLFKSNRNRNYANCMCFCGNSFITNYYYKTGPKSKSCGCDDANFVHGMHRTKENQCWRDLKDRCYNKRNPGYKNYGGRGIKVCTRWIKSFLNFHEDMGNSPGKGYSLDRIDNSKGYYKENCRWANMKTQSSNTRRNVSIKFNGEVKILREWARIYSFHLFRFHDAKKKFKTKEEALAYCISKSIQKSSFVTIP